MDPRIYIERAAPEEDALALVYAPSSAQSRQGVSVSQSYRNFGMAAEAEV